MSMRYLPISETQNQSVSVHAIKSGDGDMDEYVLQDRRSYLGNALVFWRDGGGYTANIEDAEVFTKEQAIRQNQTRETDIPWPKSYFTGKTTAIVDAQHVSISDALKGTGIKLYKQPKPKYVPERCWHCGCFINEEQKYTSCPKCKGDNRP